MIRMAFCLQTNMTVDFLRTIPLKEPSIYNNMLPQVGETSLLSEILFSYKKLQLSKDASTFPRSYLASEGFLLGCFLAHWSLPIHEPQVPRCVETPARRSANNKVFFYLVISREVGSFSTAGIPSGFPECGLKKR